MAKLALIGQTDNMALFSPVLDGEKESELAKFIAYASQLTDPPLRNDLIIIGARIKKMLDSCGAQENLFRREGGNIVALPTLQILRSKNIGVLRLYACRISDTVLIIGNGGVKKVRRYQQDPILNSHVELLKRLDKALQDRIEENDINPDDTEAVVSILKYLSF